MPFQFLNRLQSAVVWPMALALLVTACAPAPTAPVATAGKPPAAPVATSAPAASPAAAAKPAASPATKPAAPTAKPAAAKPAGELVHVTSSFQNDQWDPSKGTRTLGGVGGGMGAPVYESLFLHRPPDGEVKPYLLESGVMSPDGMSWTFKLKDGIKFSNGDPMTAEDVKFSLDHFRADTATSSGAPTLRQAIESVAVVDRLTAKVVMKQPLITLPIYLAGSTGNEGIVLPKKYAEQVGWDAFSQKPIGSGPYKVVEHKIGDVITYEANENYWGPSKPVFARIRNLEVPDEQTRLAMLKQGQANIILASPGAIPQIKAAGAQTVVMPGSSSWRIQFYGACCDHPANPLQNLDVRKALTLALNKQEMLQALYEGAGTVASYAHSDPSFSVGAPKLPPTPFDQAEARRLLASAGYANGLSIVLWAPQNAGCTPEETRRFGEATAAAWEQIGVKVDLRPIEYAVMRPKVRGNLAPEYVGTASTFCTPSTALAQRDLGNFWRSKSAWKMTDVADAEIESALTAKSQADMVRFSEAAYRKLYDAYAGIGVFHAGAVFGVSRQYADYPTTPGMINMLQWWVTDRSY